MSSRIALLLASCLWLAAQTARALACDIALVLSIDVSNSIDPQEYRIQTEGMAAALLDEEIVAALIDGKVALLVMQWSGVDKQAVSIPWARMTSRAEVEDFASAAMLMPRAFVLSDTAPAEAVIFALDQFAAVPDCQRRIIDVSGDGTPNSGADVRAARNLAETRGVTINGIAIESLGLAITGFFERALITRNGFVITARTHRDYPRAIRAKILRELSRVTA
jgi:Ca-activated chloride channel family protein